MEKLTIYYCKSCDKTYDNVCDYFGNSAFNQYVYKYMDCTETDDYYEIKTNLTNHGFMQVWQTDHYWLVNAGMGLGFGQYPKDDWTLQDAVDDQTLDEN